MAKETQLLLSQIELHYIAQTDLKLPPMPPPLPPKMLDHRCEAPHPAGSTVLICSPPFPGTGSPINSRERNWVAQGDTAWTLSPGGMPPSTHLLRSHTATCGLPRKSSADNGGPKATLQGMEDTSHLKIADRRTPRSLGGHKVA